MVLLLIDNEDLPARKDEDLRYLYLNKSGKPFDFKGEYAFLAMSA